MHVDNLKRNEKESSLCKKSCTCSSRFGCYEAVACTRHAYERLLCSYVLEMIGTGCGSCILHAGFILTMNDGWFPVLDGERVTVVLRTICVCVCVWRPFHPRVSISNVHIRTCLSHGLFLHGWWGNAVPWWGHETHCNVVLPRNLTRTVALPQNILLKKLFVIISYIFYIESEPLCGIHVSSC